MKFRGGGRTINLQFVERRCHSRRKSAVIHHSDKRYRVCFRPFRSRMNILRPGFLLLFSSVVLLGCASTAILPEQSKLDCPVTVLPCRPGSFDIVTIDTGSTTISGFHPAISRVHGLDGERDEFGLTFPSHAAGNLLVTLRPASPRGFQSGTDSIMEARLRDVDDVLPGRPIAADGVDGSIGGTSVMADGDTIYASARLHGRVASDYDLIAGTVHGDVISAPHRLAISSVRTWDAQPALSPDGRSLYFASNRRDGIGGTDIYVSRRGSSGTWSDAKNIGAGVNTPCDELSPWVSGDGKWLYFSSAGHATVGGYDLFRAPISGDAVGEAQNLGRPINTPDDEFFPSAPASASPDTLLYYSSNQHRPTGFDIYVLHSVKGRKPARDTAAMAGNPRDGNRASHGDGKTPTRINGSPRTSIPSDTARDTASLPVTPSDTLVLRVNFPFDNATDPYRFTFDDRGLPTTEQWTDMLDTVAWSLRRIHGISHDRFEIVGHTDTIGTEPFNLDLGQRRATFVRDELIRRGVPPGMLSARSEGKALPLPMFPNEPEEQYLARLRRVEIVRTHE
ncbi:MAG: OmpA/MotB protein [Chlorobi bacterium]|nr:OmpA/MotB protein [Chlorobiota bacterium]